VRDESKKTLSASDSKALRMVSLSLLKLLCKKYGKENQI